MGHLLAFVRLAGSRFNRDTSDIVCRNDPFEPSVYPGAGSSRICTAARFSSIASGKVFTVLNTHLDDQSDEQRRLAASMLWARARYEAVNKTGPVFVIGDFNRCVLGGLLTTYN